MSVDTGALDRFMEEIGTGAIDVVDLTHTLGPATPMIKVPEGHGKQPPLTSLETISDYREDGGYARWSTLTTAEHSGTHFDTPSHWFTGGDHENASTDTIAVERFIAPACVINCVEDVQKDEDFILTADRLHAWEEEHGRIPAGSWVLLHSGWADRFDDPDRCACRIRAGRHLGERVGEARVQVVTDVPPGVGLDRRCAVAFPPRTATALGLVVRMQASRSGGLPGLRVR